MKELGSTETSKEKIRTRERRPGIYPLPILENKADPRRQLEGSQADGCWQTLSLRMNLADKGHWTSRLANRYQANSRVQLAEPHKANRLKGHFLAEAETRSTALLPRGGDDAADARERFTEGWQHAY